MDRTENTARHEAAHAVAAHALGLPVLSVDADPGGFPVTRFRSRVVDNWDRAVVSMAGPIAEGRHPAEGVVCEALADLDWQDEEDHDYDLASALAEYPASPARRRRLPGPGIAAGPTAVEAPRRSASAVSSSTSPGSRKTRAAAPESSRLRALLLRAHTRYEATSLGTLQG
jgi:hypothetical protein